MNPIYQYSSKIYTEGERIVYKLSDREILIETRGLYYIKTDGRYYQGIDYKFDPPVILKIIQRGD